jgi:signal transduction histidine kinase
MMASISIRRWPLAAKVPLMVAVLMLLVAVLMSSGVMLRLAHEQQSRVAALAGAYLEGATAALAPALARRDIWDAFDTLDRFRHNFAALDLRLAAAILPDGTVLAATDPRRLRAGAALPADLARRLGTGLAPNLEIDADGDRAWMAREIRESGISLGRVLVEIDLTQERAARRRLGLLLGAANAALAVALALLGWWLTARMLRPVRLLTRHLGRAGTGAPRPLHPRAHAGLSAEFADLFATFDAMARAAGEREALAARLAEEERLATLGTLAGSMAHEVNNPLGGMMTALDTLDRHGADAAVRAQSVGFLRRGLADIRNVVRSSLVLYKAQPGPALLTAEALDDLRHLVGPEAARRRVRLDWDNRVTAVRVVDASAVRQAVLNLLLNAVAASPPQGVVRLDAAGAGDRLSIVIADDGPGLPAPFAAMLGSDAQAPPPGSFGLGLWGAQRAAQALGGTLERMPSLHGTVLALRIPVEVAHAAALA